MENNRIEALLQRGIEFHENRQFIEAEACYKEVLGVDPNNADAIHLLGLLADSIGDKELAVELIGYAIAVDPSSALFRNNLANILKNIGKTELAIASYLEAIRLNPAYPDACINLSNLYRALGKQEESIHYYQKAAQFDPGLAEAYGHLAATHPDRLDRESQETPCSTIHDAIARKRESVVSPSDRVEHANAEQDSIPVQRPYSRPSPKKFNKVFGIGANKTGTTSLKKIFHDLGLMVAPQQEGEICGMQAYKGDFEPLIGYITQYDAFQDAPFSIKYTFAQVDALFPGSKFILTYRDPETWFASLMNFHKKIFNLPEAPTEEDIKRAHYLFPDYIHFLTKHIWAIDVDDDLSVKLDWSLLYNKDHYINEYNNRNKAIVRHFSARPDDLLVIDITNENDTSKIVNFLGLPDELITSVPHENRT